MGEHSCRKFVYEQKYLERVIPGSLNLMNKQNISLKDANDGDIAVDTCMCRYSPLMGFV